MRIDCLSSSLYKRSLSLGVPGCHLVLEGVELMALLIPFYAIDLRHCCPSHRLLLIIFFGG